MGATTTTGSTHRIERWRDLIREHFVALDIDAARDERFRGAVASTGIGHLKVASVDSTAAEYRRTPGLARADHDAYLQVGLVTRGTAVLRQDGREALLRAGDYAVYETGRPFFWALCEDVGLSVYTWPRASIALQPAESQRLTARALGGAGGLGGIVGRMLAELVTAPPALSPAGAVRLAHEVGELVTTVAGEQAGPATPDRAAADLLHAVDAYLAEHLADPDLHPASVARAHFVSTRHLHRLFAQRGTTVTQHVRHLRLERCRRELACGPDVPIFEIARRWGFADAATFSRAFRQAYGTTPSAYRNGHGAAGPG